MELKNKRLLAVIAGTLCSSIVVGVALFKVPPEAICEVLKGYFLLIATLSGVYTGSQTITDHSKLQKGV